jgi:hypothetical protein
MWYRPYSGGGVEFRFIIDPVTGTHVYIDHYRGSMTVRVAVSGYWAGDEPLDRRASGRWVRL